MFQSTKLNYSFKPTKNVHILGRQARQADIHTDRHKERQDRQAGRQTGGHTNRQTDRQTDRQTNRQSDRQTDSQSTKLNYSFKPTVELSIFTQV